MPPFGKCWSCGEKRFLYGAFLRKIGREELAHGDCQKRERHRRSYLYAGQPAKHHGRGLHTGVPVAKNSQRLNGKGRRRNMGDTVSRRWLLKNLMFEPDRILALGAPDAERQGTWITKADDPGVRICSECGRKYNMAYYDAPNMRCCMCGARMNGGELHERR